METSSAVRGAPTSGRAVPENERQMAINVTVIETFDFDPFMAFLLEKRSSLRVIKPFKHKVCILATTRSVGGCKNQYAEEHYEGK